MKKCEDNGVIVITGASNGLGRELASYIYKKTIPLALIARNKLELDTIKASLDDSACNESVTIHSIDLTKSEEVNSCFDNILNIHKRIRALINCAATWTGGKSVKELSIENIHDSLMLNFFSCLHPIKALLSIPKEFICDPTTIINIGATASLRGAKNCSAFAIAKGALRQLSQCLAKELGADGIHVAHVIIDGLIDNKRTRLLNPKLKDNEFINMGSISEMIFTIIQQEKSCWTFELDMRPFNESW